MPYVSKYQSRTKWKPKQLRSKTRGGKRPRSGDVKLSVALAPMARAVDGPRLLTLAGIVILTVILLNLFTSAQYGVGVVRVRGNQGTATRDIEEAISFVQGQSVFLVRTDEVKAAVTALPGIQKVEARVALPNELHIAVSDTRPEYMWVAANSTILWVDANGLVRDQPAKDPERRITILDVSGRTYKKGDKVDAAALRAATELNVTLARDVQAFEFQRENELIVVSAHGWRAQFNTFDALEPQIKALRKILASVPGVIFVDVRVPDRVTYRTG